MPSHHLAAFSTKGPGMVISWYTREGLACLCAGKDLWNANKTKHGNSQALWPDVDCADCKGTLCCLPPSPTATGTRRCNWGRGGVLGEGRGGERGGKSLYTLDSPLIFLHRQELKGLCPVYFTFPFVTYVIKTFLYRFAVTYWWYFWSSADTYLNFQNPHPLNRMRFSFALMWFDSSNYCPVSSLTPPPPTPIWLRAGLTVLLVRWSRYSLPVHQRNASQQRPNSWT